MPSERLGRWLARTGLGSRRQVDRLLASGRVTVDGRVAPPGGQLIDPERDRVAVDGHPVLPAPGPRRYLALNKPLGVVSSARDPGRRQVVLDLVPDRRGLFPVGRLDTDSRGLMLITDDGSLALRLTHPRYQVPKTYRLSLAGRLEPSQLEQLARGPVLADGPTHPLSLRVLRLGPRRSLLELVLAEGRHRELRRMAAAVGAAVLDLERVAIGPLRLGSLAEGRCRELGGGEVARLRRLVGLE